MGNHLIILGTAPAQDMAHTYSIAGAWDRNRKKGFVGSRKKGVGELAVNAPFTDPGHVNAAFRFWRRAHTRDQLALLRETSSHIRQRPTL